MAQSQHCDLCEQEQALITIITNASGDVIMVGANCMPIFYLTAVGEILDGMPEENRKAYAEVLQPIIHKLAALDGRAGEDIAGPAAIGDPSGLQLVSGDPGDGAQAPADGAQAPTGRTRPARGRNGA